MNKQKIKCAECGKEMTTINNKHLLTHSMSMQDYKNKFPTAPIMTQEVFEKLSKRSVIANADRKGKPRSEKDLIAIRAGAKAAGLAKVGIKLGPKPLEQKLKQSEIMKKMYADGVIVPSNKGGTITQEHKDKISIKLIGHTRSEESKLKQQQTRIERGIPLPSFSGRTHTEETRKIIAKKSSERQLAQRADIRAVMLSRISESNLILLNDISDNIFRLECKLCNYVFTRTPQCFQPSKFHTKICDQCFPISAQSAAELLIGDYVKSLLPENERIILGDMEVIFPLELDIHIPSKNIAIEYCGLWWHSELYGRHRFYHQKKMATCADKGIRLITIFEDEWLNKPDLVKSMLKNALGTNDIKINAKKCEVREINSTEANAFLNLYHMQGRGRSKIQFGLFLKNQLVSVMTFSDSEVSRRRTGWEINRFCTKSGMKIYSGASKLFNAFVEKFDPNEVISYADLRWGTGNVYKYLGFTKSNDTVPNYWYFRTNEIKRTHRYALRKTENDPKDQTEWEIRQEEGWNRIWDCGHAKWIWVKKPK